jgi:uncharacterized protein
VRIIIAGGSGFLGRALSSTLKAGGHDVRTLTRRARHAGDVEWSPGTGSQAWMTSVAEADAVVNLAGEGIADKRWTPARKALLRDSRLRATRALVKAITASPTRPRILISSSGVGYYGDRGSAIVTESAAPGSDFLASLCVEWEAEAMAAAPAARVVLLRTGLVLARHGGALPRLAMPFWFFAGGPLGSGGQYQPWIHLDDWVGIVRWALGNNVAGPVNMTAPEPVTNRELARTLGRVIHRPALFPAPAFAMRLMLGEMADAAILSGQRAIPEKALSGGYVFRFSTLEPALDAVYNAESREPRA